MKNIIIIGFIFCFTQGFIYLMTFNYISDKEIDGSYYDLTRIVNRNFYNIENDHFSRCDYDKNGLHCWNYFNEQLF